MMRLSEECRVALLLTADSCLALVVFFPSLISYWRGIWDLLGVYIFPGREPLNHWTTAAIGAMSVFGYFILPRLKKKLQPWKNSKKRSKRIQFYVASRLYMYTYAAFYMAYWRGLWSLGDFYMLAHGWKGDVIMLVTLYAVLSVLRCSRTIIFPPYVVTLDTRGSLMEASTRFGMKPHEPVKYMLDSVMTHFIIIPLAILTWRSAWATVGAFLFPHDPWLSDVIALAIGAPSTILLFAFQAPLAKISRLLEERGNNFQKLLYEDFVYLITTLCQFFIWRGGWNLNARYLLADPLVGGWVNHVVGTFLLMALQLFSYVSACGCAVDGFDPRGKAIYPIRYLRHYLRSHKKPKSEKPPMDSAKRIDKDAKRIDKDVKVPLKEKLPEGRADSATDEQNNSVAESSFDTKLSLKTTVKINEDDECESLMRASVV